MCERFVESFVAKVTDKLDCSLRTAIQLKTAIDEAPQKLQSIGTCRQTELEWKMENYGEVDNEEDQTALEQLDNLKKTLDGKYYTEFEEITGQITVGHYTGELGIPQEILHELFSNATDSPFGDVKNLQTVVDKDVRNAREILEFQVSDDVIQKIEEQWTENLFPTKVKAVPYKINMYKSDGHFNEHLDTPETNLVGTALVSLWVSTDYRMPSLCIKNLQKDKKFVWEPKNPSCVMFYSDCPHEVRSGSWRYNGDPIRATIAFKIFSVNEEENMEQFQVERTKDALGKLDLSNTGFILEHGYSLDTESLKGNDVLLCNALKQMGYQFKLHPIMYHFSMSSNHEREENFETNIYLLRQEEIEYVLGRAPRPETPYSDLNFYILDAKHFTWKRDYQEHVEFTGNNSRPEEENSIYLSRALIIL